MSDISENLLGYRLAEKWLNSFEFQEIMAAILGDKPSYDKLEGFKEALDDGIYFAVENVYGINPEI